MSIAREAEKHVVITWLNHLEPELPVVRLIQLTEGFKSHVIDTD
jgi:hypothetical protein